MSRMFLIKPSVRSLLNSWISPRVWRISTKDCNSLNHNCWRSSPSTVWYKRTPWERSLTLTSTMPCSRYFSFIEEMKPTLSLSDPGPGQGSQHCAGCPEDWLYSARQDHSARGCWGVQEIGKLLESIYIFWKKKHTCSLYDNSCWTSLITCQ